MPPGWPSKRRHSTRSNELKAGFTRLRVSGFSAERHRLQAPLPWREWKAATEREYLEAVLRRAEWSFTAAAKLLDLQRTFLHEKAAALGLERPRRDRGEG